MTQILETERLRLREFTKTDTKFIIELVNSEGWLKYIGDRNIKTEADALAYLEKGPLKSYPENGFGLAMVEIKGSNIPIGMCGLIKRDNLENPDIGFAFLPAFTGKGYAYEIAKATMDDALDKLYIKTILGITVPYNKNSIRLLEKLGLKFIKTIKTDDDTEELMLFGNS